MNLSLRASLGKMGNLYNPNKNVAAPNTSRIVNNDVDLIMDSVDNHGSSQANLESIQ